MKKNKILFLFLFLFGIAQGTFAADFAVRIYSQFNIKSLTFTSLIGKYTVEGDETPLEEADKNNIYTISIEKNKIRVKKDLLDLGLFNTIDFSGGGLKNIFRIKPSNTDAKERIYDDDVMISVEKGYLKIINNVEIENYVAGVVQSEILGSCDSIEFFKIQAIISRTYAINNMMKHYKDGYNLCDDVHCQAYKSRCNKFGILMAATLTSGDVIVDNNKRMISASFCSNSGGETINSEDLWAIPTTYLKAVKDTFSNGMRNSVWEYKMNARDWLKYLENNFKYPVEDSSKVHDVFHFEQNTRKLFLADSIPLKYIRRDLGLKSTFFSISKQGDMVVFKGKGYGHGVGLSQEGAIKMVKYRYRAKDIIKFYYKDVDIINYQVIKKIE